MKTEDQVYCVDESVYSDYITKRQTYAVADSKPDQVRIQNDNGWLVWLPEHCFTQNPIPEIADIHLDDAINDPLNDCVEVTVTFDNGEKRWATFMTLKWLQGLFSEHRDFVLGSGLILVEKLDPQIIERTINHLDRQNELIAETKKYES